MKILAFPGMGKTPLSKKSGKYLDLDFGHYRESLSVQKDNEAKILSSFQKLADMYERDGFIVLSNDPKLLDHGKWDKMYLPVDPKFAARKLQVDIPTAQQWINDWCIAAKEHQVPVIWVERGLDHYLLTGMGALNRKEGKHEESTKRTLGNRSNSRKQRPKPVSRKSSDRQADDASLVVVRTREC